MPVLRPAFRIFEQQRDSAKFDHAQVDDDELELLDSDEGDELLSLEVDELDEVDRLLGLELLDELLSLEFVELDEEDSELAEEFELLELDEVNERLELLLLLSVPLELLDSSRSQSKFVWMNTVMRAQCERLSHSGVFAERTSTKSRKKFWLSLSNKSYAVSAANSRRL